MPGEAKRFINVLDGIQNDPVANSYSSDEISSLFHNAADSYIKKGNISDQNEINSIRKLVSNRVSLNRNLQFQGRDFDSTKSFFESQSPFQPVGSNEDEKLDSVDTWAEETKRNILSSPYSYAYNDIEYFVDQEAFAKKREVTGEDSGRTRDLAARFANSAAVRPMRALGDVFEQDYLKDSADAFQIALGENPKYDDKFLSQLTSATGDIVGSILVFGGATVAGTAASGGNPIAGGVIGAGTGFAYNAALGYSESYREVLSKTGDENQAIEAGINSLPAAVVESLADKLIAGKFIKGKLAQEIFESRSLAETRKALSTAYKDANFRKLLATGTVSALQESASEVAGDIIRGYGKLAAVEEIDIPLDERDSLFPTGSDLVTTAAVSAIVGGGAGSIGAGSSRFRYRRAVDKAKATTDQIAKRLESGDVDGALSLARESNINISKEELEDAEKQSEARRSGEAGQESGDGGTTEGRQQQGAEAQPRPSAVPEGEGRDEQAGVTAGAAGGRVAPAAQPNIGLRAGIGTEQDIRRKTELFEELFSDPAPERRSEIISEIQNIDNLYKGIAGKDLISRIKSIPELEGLSLPQRQAKIREFTEDSGKIVDTAYDAIARDISERNNLAPNLNPVDELSRLESELQSLDRNDPENFEKEQQLLNKISDLTLLSNISEPRAEKIKGREDVIRDIEDELTKARKEGLSDVVDDLTKSLQANFPTGEAPSGSEVQDIKKEIESAAIESLSQHLPDASPEEFSNLLRSSILDQGLQGQGVAPAPLPIASGNLQSEIRRIFPDKPESFIRRAINAVLDFFKKIANFYRTGGLIRGTEAGSIDARSEIIKSKNVHGTDLRRALDVIFGQDFYADDYPQVVHREVVQNSIDALNTSFSNGKKYLSAQTTEHVEKNGIVFNAAMDNGVGMSPNDVIEKFLPAFVTGKTKGVGDISGAEGTKFAGGFGMAKIVLLGGTEDFSIITRNLNESGESIETTVKATGEAWKDFAMSSHSIPDNIIAPFSANLSGVQIDVVNSGVKDDSPRGGETIDRFKTGTIYVGSYNKNDGGKKNSSYGSVDLYGSKSELSYNPEWSYKSYYDLDDAIYEELKKFNEWLNGSYDLDRKSDVKDLEDFNKNVIDVPGAEITLYTHKDEVDTIWYGQVSFPVLNQGIEQFKGKIKIEEDDIELPSMVIQVSPTVDATSADYPFNKNRDQLAGPALKKVTDFANSLGSARKRAQLEELTSSQKKALLKASNGAEMQLFGISSELSEDDLNFISNLTSVKNFGSFIDSLNKSPMLENLKGVFGDFSFDGVSIHPEAYGFRFGTISPRSDGSIFINPILMVHGPSGSNQRATNPDSSYYNDSISEYDHFVDILTGVIVHEVSHQLSHSEGESHAREMTFAMNTILRGSNFNIDGLLRENFNEKDYFELLNETKDIDEKIDSAYNRQISKDIINTINKGFTDERSIQIIGSRGVQDTPQRSISDSKTDRGNRQQQEDRFTGSETIPQIQQFAAPRSDFESDEVSSGGEKYKSFREGEADNKGYSALEVPGSEAGATIGYIHSSESNLTGEVSDSPLAQEQVQPNIGLTQDEGIRPTDTDQPVAETATTQEAQETQTQEGAEAQQAPLSPEITKAPKWNAASRVVARIRKRDVKSQKLQSLKSRLLRVSRGYYSALARSNPDLANQYLELSEEFIKGKKVDIVDNNIANVNYIYSVAQEAYYNEQIARNKKIAPTLSEKVTLEQFREDPELLRQTVANIASKQEKRADRENKAVEAARIELDAVQREFEKISEEDFLNRVGKNPEVRKKAKLVYDGVRALDPTQFDKSSELKKRIAGINDMLIDDSAIVDGDYYVLGDVHAETEKAVDAGGIRGMFRDPAIFLKSMTGLFRSTDARIDSMTKYTSVRDWIIDNVLAPFEKGWNKYFRQYKDSEKELAEKQKEIFKGKKPADERKMVMGLMQFLRQYNVDKDPAQQLQMRMEGAKDSIDKLIQAYDRSSGRIYKGAARLRNVLNEVERAIKFDGDPVADFQSVYNQILSDQEREYIDWIADHFNKTYRDGVKFVTEALHGQPFDEFAHYITDSQIVVNKITGAADTAKIETGGPIGELMNVVNPHQINNYGGKQQVAHQRKGSSKDRVYQFNIDNLALKGFKAAAIEMHTGFERKKLQYQLSDNSPLIKAINTTNKGEYLPHLRRGAEFKKIFDDRIINEINSGAPEGEVFKLFKKAFGIYGAAALSSPTQIIKQPAASFTHYLAERAFDPNSKKFLIEAFEALAGNPRAKDFIHQFAPTISERSANGEPWLEKRVNVEDLPRSSVSKGIEHALERTQHWSTYFIRKGDKASAEVVLLAEYGLAVDARMKKAGLPGLNSLHDIDWQNPDQGSLVRARRATEYNVNSSQTSQKGGFLQNNNNWVSGLRDLVVAFRSHSINLASKAMINARDIHDWGYDPSVPEVRQAVANTVGIIAQAAMFRGLSFYASMAVAAYAISHIKDAEEDAEDSEFDKLLKKREAVRQLPSGPLQQALLAQVNADIEWASKIRNVVTDVRRSRSSGKAATGQILNDVLGNLFIPYIFIDSVGAKKFVLGNFDGISKEHFDNHKLVEQAKLKQQARIAREFGLADQAASYEKQWKAWDDMNYIPLSAPEFHHSSLGGMAGLVMSRIITMKNLAGNTITDLGEVSANDWIAELAAISPLFPEVASYMRVIDKIDEKSFEAEKNLRRKERREEALLAQ